MTTNDNSPCGRPHARSPHRGGDYGISPRAPIPIVRSRGLCYRRRRGNLAVNLAALYDPADCRGAKEDAGGKDAGGEDRGRRSASSGGCEDQAGRDLLDLLTGSGCPSSRPTRPSATRRQNTRHLRRPAAPADRRQRRLAERRGGDERASGTGLPAAKSARLSWLTTARGR